ncbi:MAG: SDR family oxidoreductase [Hyphomicrobiaceae bacterium]
MMHALIDAWLRRKWRPQQGHDAFAGRQALAVVTGGSEGIGLELARELARRGHALLLVARKEASLERAAEAIRREHGGRVETLALDLTHAEAGAILAERVHVLGAYVDVLVNNAAIGLSGAFTSMDRQDIRRLVELNVASLSELTHRFLPDMVLRGRGGVINVTSLGCYAPGPWAALYFASKAYVLSLTEAVRHEVAGQGVRVMALVPGPVATGFHAKMGSDASFYLWCIPVYSARTVARSALRAYMMGRRVKVVGVLNEVSALGMRMLPHLLLLPVIGFLFRRRDEGKTDV